MIVVVLCNIFDLNLKDFILSKYSVTFYDEIE